MLDGSVVVTNVAGYFGDDVTDQFINPETGDAINEYEIKGFKYNHYTPQGGFKIDVKHDKTIYLYYNRNYYPDPDDPDPDPAAYLPLADRHSR